MLTVPFYKQDTGYTCGPTALQMVLEYYGTRLSEAYLAERLNTQKTDGTKHGPLIAIAREEGFFVYVHNRSTLDEIAQFLDHAIPVIVHYIEASSNEGHYAVVIGVTDHHVTLNDPWNGERYILDRENFTMRWHDEAGDAIQWMLALSKEPFAIGRQYAPAG